MVVPASPDQEETSRRIWNNHYCMTDDYSFRALNVDDLNVLAQWLKSPDVAYWYPDPDYIDDLEEHLDDDRVRQQIVSFRGTPFAYLQDYDVHGWEDHHLSFLPKGSRGLDTFIGSGEMLDQGHGTKFLHAAIQKLFNEGVPALGIDPDPLNKRAIKAYLNIGFAGDGEIQTEWGIVRIMHLSVDMFKP